MNHTWGRKGAAWADKFLKRQSRPTLASTPGRSARNWVATVCRASLGHSLNQSMVVQFTRLGNLRSRSLNSPPTGLKLSTMCRLRFTCIPNQRKMKRCSANEIRPAGLVGLCRLLAEEPQYVTAEWSVRAAHCQSAVCSKEGAAGFCTQLDAAHACFLSSVMGGFEHRWSCTARGYVSHAKAVQTAAAMQHAEVRRHSKLILELDSEPGPTSCKKKL